MFAVGEKKSPQFDPADLFGSPPHPKEKVTGGIQRAHPPPETLGGEDGTQTNTPFEKETDA